MKILQIGCGNMGGVIAKIASKHYEDITILTNTPKNETPKFNFVWNLQEIEGQKFDVIILATKPQDFANVLSLSKIFANENTVFLSIMAGLSVNFLSKKLQSKNVIRTMPNLGLEQNCGITLVAKKNFLPVESEIITQIFGKDGNILLNVDDEEINKLTAITGSGCALFLNLAKHMAKIGKTEEPIIKSVLMQAFNMMKIQTCDDAISKIASKGGITEAMINASKDLFENACKIGIEAGQKRAETLANEIENNIK